MQVFNVYFIIIRKNLPQLLIYVVVFITLAVLLTMASAESQQTGFTESRINIAFFNYDNVADDDLSSALTGGLGEFLSKSSNIITIEDNPEKLQDALFFQKIAYIVRIPAGFTKSFIEGGNAGLEKTSIPDATSSLYTDMLINKYLNTARLYINSIKDLSGTKLTEYLDKTLDIKTPIEVKTYDMKTGKTEDMLFFFNYMAYTLLSVLILGVSTCMIVFNDPDLKRRNLCAPVTQKSRNMQMLAGNLVFAIVFWALMIAMGVALYGGKMFTQNAFYLCLNSFVFTLVCLSISFLTGNALKSRNAQAAVSNVLTLGMCFIGGVFVPQFLLSKSVLDISSFTPVYWFVKANNEIISLVRYNRENLAPVFNYMLIEFGFAVAILAVALVVIKQKRLSNS